MFGAKWKQNLQKFKSNQKMNRKRVQDAHQRFRSSKINPEDIDQDQMNDLFNRFINNHQGVVGENQMDEFENFIKTKGAPQRKKKNTTQQFEEANRSKIEQILREMGVIKTEEEHQEYLYPTKNRTTTGYNTQVDDAYPTPAYTAEDLEAMSDIPDITEVGMGDLSELLQTQGYEIPPEEDVFEKTRAAWKNLDRNLMVDQVLDDFDFEF